MWDDISASALMGLATIGVSVSCGLAFMNRSMTRAILLVAWTVAPFMLALAASAIGAIQKPVFDATAFFGFLAVFSLVTLPPWALLTLLPFHSVRRWHEVRSGIDYRAGY